MRKAVGIVVRTADSYRARRTSRILIRILIWGQEGVKKLSIDPAMPLRK